MCRYLQQTGAVHTQLARGSGVHNCNLTMCLTPIRDCRWITDLPLISWRENAFIYSMVNLKVPLCRPRWDLRCTLRCTLHCVPAEKSELYVFDFQLVRYLHLILSFFLCTLCFLPTQGTHLLWEDIQGSNICLTRAHSNLCRHTGAHRSLFTFPFCFHFNFPSVGGYSTVHKMLLNSETLVWYFSRKHQWTFIVYLFVCGHMWVSTASWARGLMSNTSQPLLLYSETKYYFIYTTSPHT